MSNPENKKYQAFEKSIRRHPNVVGVDLEFESQEPGARPKPILVVFMDESMNLGALSRHSKYRGIPVKYVPANPINSSQ